MTSALTLIGFVLLVSGHVSSFHSALPRARRIQPRSRDGQTRRRRNGDGPIRFRGGERESTLGAAKRTLPVLPGRRAGAGEDSKREGSAREESRPTRFAFVDTTGMPNNVNMLIKPKKKNNHSKTGGANGRKQKSASGKKTAKIIAKPSRTEESGTESYRSKSTFSFYSPKRITAAEIDIVEEEREMASQLANAEISLEKLLIPLAVTGAASALAYYVATTSAVNVDELRAGLDAFASDPTGTLQSTLDGLGPLAVVYFGLLYVAAELLALPATPFTLSAGALFGLTEGTAAVLVAGTVSAIIGFFIGKTVLRQYVEELLEENPKFKKLDRAIGVSGFKLLLLVRLSPIFPFSLINYTYGASSVPFPTFVAGTLIGFAPSTVGYVYSGLAGKELLSGESTQPWYFYAGGAAVLFGFLKLVTDVATEVVEAIDEEEEGGEISV